MVPLSKCLFSCNSSDGRFPTIYYCHYSYPFSQVQLNFFIHEYFLYDIITSRKYDRWRKNRFIDSSSFYITYFRNLITSNFLRLAFYLNRSIAPFAINDKGITNLRSNRQSRTVSRKKKNRFFAFFTSRWAYYHPSWYMRGHWPYVIYWLEKLVHAKAAKRRRKVEHSQWSSTRSFIPSPFSSYKELISIAMSL